MVEHVRHCDEWVLGNLQAVVRDTQGQHYVKCPMGYAPRDRVARLSVPVLPLS